MTVPANATGADRARILKAAAALGGNRPGSDRARRLLTRVCDPRIELGELEAEVAQEPSLYARVLKVANSAYYRNTKSVTTVGRAIIVLGLDAVRGIVAAGCLDPLVGRQGDATVDAEAIITHSLATAVVADLVATRHAPAVRQDAFVAGLLHNLGIFVQLRLDAAAVGRLAAACSAEPARPIRELEAAAGLPGHEACLGIAFDEWAMSAPIAAVARHHHGPGEAPEAHRDLVCVVHVGALIAVANGNGHRLEPAAASPCSAALEALGLGAEDLAALTAAAANPIRELATALRAA